MIEYFVHKQTGQYLGAYEGPSDSNPYSGHTAVPSPPPHAGQKWNKTKKRFDPLPPDKTVMVDQLKTKFKDFYSQQRGNVSKELRQQIVDLKTRLDSYIALEDYASIAEEINDLVVPESLQPLKNQLLSLLGE